MGTGLLSRAGLGLALGVLIMALWSAPTPAGGAAAPQATPVARVTRKFNLTPGGALRQDLVKRQAFARRVIEAVRTYLYTPREAQRAAAEGRGMAYDPARMELTLTETPERVERIATYLAALPELRPGQSWSQSVLVRHQPAAAILGQLTQLATAPAAGGGRSELSRLFQRVTVTTSTRPNELLVTARDETEWKNALQLLQMFDRPEKQFELQMLVLEKKTTATAVNGPQAVLNAIEMCRRIDFDAAARLISADPELRATPLRKLRTAEDQPCLVRLEKSHTPGTPADTIELSARLRDLSGVRFDAVVTCIRDGQKTQASSTFNVLPDKVGYVVLPGVTGGGSPNLPCLLVKARRVQ